jgi:hypothetical protein
MFPLIRQNLRIEVPLQFKAAWRSVLNEDGHGSQNWSSRFDRGHSVHYPEVMYGMAVTRPERLGMSDTATEGDEEPTRNHSFVAARISLNLCFCP